MQVEATELQGLIYELEHRLQKEELQEDLTEKKKIAVNIRLDEETVSNLDILATRYGYVRSRFAKMLLERAIEDCLKTISTIGQIHVKEEK